MPMHGSQLTTVLDRVDSIDIVDINAGSHGRWFSTNFDPEINFREFTGTVYSWQHGQVAGKPDVRGGSDL